MRAAPATIPALDGLRGLAALLVFFCHVRNTTHMTVDAIAKSWFWRFSLSGDMGVDLFFVLSGFLITSILLRNVREPGALKAFWMRRVLRIFPLNYLYLVVLVVLGATTHLFDVPGDDVPSSVLGWAPFFFYMSNFALLAHGEMAVEVIILWSLAVEEQFYAIWPLIVRRHDDASLVRLVIAAIVLAPLIRLGFAVVVPNADAYYFLPFCRMDSIFAGALIALQRDRIVPIARRCVVPAIVVIVFFLQRKNYHEEPKSLAWIALYYSVIAIAWATVVAAVLHPSKPGRWLFESAPLRYVGRVSYGLYLWHPLIGRLLWVAGASRLAPLPFVALHLAASLAFASLSFRFFERPILALKDRFEYAHGARVS